MVDLGYKLRELRKRSPLNNVFQLAQKAELSAEAIRKIENGERVPSEQTLSSILTALDASEQDVREMKRERDLAHAEREGLLNKGLTDEKVEEVAVGTIESFLEFLSEYDMALSDEDTEELRSRTIAAIMARLYE